MSKRVPTTHEACAADHVCGALDARLGERRKALPMGRRSSSLSSAITATYSCVARQRCGAALAGALIVDVRTDPLFDDAVSRAPPVCSPVVRVELGAKLAWVAQSRQEIVFAGVMTMTRSSRAARCGSVAGRRANAAQIACDPLGGHDIDLPGPKRIRTGSLRSDA